MLTAWGKHELPCQAPPLDGILLDAFLGFLLVEGFVDVMIVGWCMHDGIMRTDEAMRLDFENLSLEPTRAIANITEGKTVTRHGRVERAEFTDVNLCRLLINFEATVGGIGPVLQRSPRQLRAIFAHAAEQLGLARMGLKPYGFKRGGATSHFREGGSLDLTAEKGRWQNLKTARLYVNTSLAAYTSMQIPPTSVPRLRYYAAHSPRL